MGTAVTYVIEKSSESRLPPMDGTITLECLDHPGTIKYDTWGVPHIYASTRNDGYRLQGFVTAQHRCFQLVQTHLVIHGKLSSVVGSAGKPIDIFSRTCNFKALGEEDWEHVFTHNDQYESAIDMVSSYTEGINAWFTHPKFQFPVELSSIMLNYTPEKWKQSDVMSVGRILSLKMSDGWSSKMISTLLTQIVGSKNAEWFCFDTEKVYECPYNDTQTEVTEFYKKLKDIGKLLEPQNQPIMKIKPWLKHSYFKDKPKYISPVEWKDNDRDQKVDDLDAEATETVMDMEHGGASNAFVVSGAHTNTGKPILCNDPHLVVNVPNPMFYCHLTVESDENKEENLHWTGLQPVGLPSTVIGHTDNIAIGITVGVCDTTDIFVERFENEESNKYEVDGEWKECVVREEIIAIKNEDDLVLKVRETHHGPILDPTEYTEGIEKGPYSHVAETKKQENESYHLRYSFCAAFLKHRNEIKDFACPVEGYVDVLDCTNIHDAAQCLQKVAFPNLNLILADVCGNFGWVTNGMIPIRNHTETYNPILPQPGWRSEYDWAEYIAVNELPSNMNPKQGYAVSCNNSPVDPDHYPYYLGVRFSMGFRAKRACELIDDAILNEDKMTMDDLSAIQTDCLDLSAKEMISNVLKPMDLSKMIATHEIELGGCKWVMSVMNEVIPKEMRNGADVGAKYYNDKSNRKKADFAWQTLSEWDFEYGIESVGATIYDTFLTVLLRRVVMTGIYRGYCDSKEEEKEQPWTDAEVLELSTKLSENLLRNSYNKTFAGLTAFIYKRFGVAITMLSSEDESCWWIANYGNRENILIMALIDAVDCIEFWSQTKDRSKWNWGSLHEIEIFHPMSAKLGSKPFNSSVYPVSGGHHTLNMFRPNYNAFATLKNPFKVTQSGIPVWRQIIDCGNWSNSKCVLAMGISGQVSSPYYQNLLKLLVQNEYIPMLWTKQDVEAHLVSQMQCNPFQTEDAQKRTCQIL
eukprot:585063_1